MGRTCLHSFGSALLVLLASVSNCTGQNAEAGTAGTSPAPTLAANETTVQSAPTDVFLILRKTREWRDERPTCSTRAFVRRESTHVDALRPHRQSLDHVAETTRFPFGSLMPYGLDNQGRPIFLISTMAMHTQNLQADPRASLFVTEPDASGDALGSSRVTLIGNALRIPEPELADARAVYLTGYPDSKYWVDFEDFFFYRLDVMDVYYVGGFGVMGWVAASDYSQAKSDPLADHKRDIMQHMNADHKDALILLAKRFAGIEAQQAEMTAVDRLGFHLRLKTQDGMKGTRIAFLREVSDPSQTREVFVEMVKQARQG